MAFAVDRERRPRRLGRLDVEKCGHWRAKYANTSELRPQKQRRSIVKRQPAGHLLKPNSRVTGVDPRITLRGRPGRTAAKTPGRPVDKQANRQRQKSQKPTGISGLKRYRCSETASIVSQCKCQARVASPGQRVEATGRGASWKLLASERRRPPSPTDVGSLHSDNATRA
jgi:hypothetical protein